MSLLQAVISFPDTSVAVLDARQQVAQRIHDLSWNGMLTMLETLRWEEHDTLRKPPASQTAIDEAEAQYTSEEAEDEAEDEVDEAEIRRSFNQLL